MVADEWKLEIAKPEIAQLLQKHPQAQEQAKARIVEAQAEAQAEAQEEAQEEVKEAEAAGTAEEDEDGLLEGLSLTEAQARTILGFQEQPHSWPRNPAIVTVTFWELEHHKGWIHDYDPKRKHSPEQTAKIENEYLIPIHQASGLDYIKDVLFSTTNWHPRGQKMDMSWESKQVAVVSSCCGEKKGYTAQLHEVELHKSALQEKNYSAFNLTDLLSHRRKEVVVVRQPKATIDVTMPALESINRKFTITAFSTYSDVIEEIAKGAWQNSPDDQVAVLALVQNMIAKN